MPDDFTAGLHRAVQIVRALARQGRNCGQTGDGPAALEAAADAIEAELDNEPTDPGLAITCQACGSPKRAG